MIEWDTFLEEQLFQELHESYGQVFDLQLAFISKGQIQFGSIELQGLDQSNRHQFSRMAEESVRWGEPNIIMLDSGAFLWCVPLCLNSEILGGFFSGCEPGYAEKRSASAIQDAAWALLDLAGKKNLINDGLMQLNRMMAHTAAKRAEAIHQSKHIFFQNPRDLLLIEEREILNAVRNRNLEGAREIINRILVGVYHAGGTDFEVLKLLLLEMVVQMYRAAVSEGAEPEILLGANSVYLADFLKVSNEDEMNSWLLKWLDLFVNLNLSSDQGAYQHTLAPAILYIKRNLDKPISRDQVAKVCHLSPSYFSHLIKEGTGYTYSDLLNRFRVDHACSLLERTSLSASEIAFASGFNDQSYFTKVFKRLRAMPPGEYRRLNRKPQQVLNNIT
jgi:AraC-like DNA-binding protein